MKWTINRCSCGSSNNFYLFDTCDYNFAVTQEICKIFRCLDCNSIFPGKFPKTEYLNEFYVNYYTSYKTHSSLRLYLRSLLDLTRKLYALRWYPKQARSVLDYGCGSGLYLSYLNDKRVNAKLFGTDLFEPVSDVKNEYTWLPLDRFDLSDQLFDWITMSHVIEHISTVEPILLRLRKVTNDKGSIWISTPNSDSFLIDCFKGHARDIDFPRHRQIYSRDSLESVLKKAGFKVQFLSAPRVKSVLNFNSSAKNIFNDKNMTKIKKIFMFLRGGSKLIKHLLSPQRLRDLVSPEIILLASPEFLE